VFSPWSSTTPPTVRASGPATGCGWRGLHAALAPHGPADLTAHNTTRGEHYRLHHRLSDRQRQAVLAGGVIPALAS
jgi:hypothetical protein